MIYDAVTPGEDRWFQLWRQSPTLIFHGCTDSLPQRPVVIRESVASVSGWSLKAKGCIPASGRRLASSNISLALLWDLPAATELGQFAGQLAQPAVDPPVQGVLGEPAAGQPGARRQAGLAGDAAMRRGQRPLPSAGSQRRGGYARPVAPKGLSHT